MFYRWESRFREVNNLIIITNIMTKKSSIQINDNTNARHDRNHYYHFKDGFGSERKSIFPKVTQLVLVCDEASVSALSA